MKTHHYFYLVFIFIAHFWWYLIGYRRGWSFIIVSHDLTAIWWLDLVGVVINVSLDIFICLLIGGWALGMKVYWMMGGELTNSIIDHCWILWVALWIYHLTSHRYVNWMVGGVINVSHDIILIWLLDLVLVSGATIIVKCCGSLSDCWNCSKWFGMCRYH